MKEKFNAIEVSKLLDRFIFFTKTSNEIIYFTSDKEMIVCFNENFKTKINKETFLGNFIDSIFFIYKEKEPIDTTEEKIVDKYYRQ